MNDILFECDGIRIECEIEGRKLTYTYSDDPKCHHVETLVNDDAYTVLKRDMREYENDPNAEFDTAWYFLETQVCDRYFVSGKSYVYHDLREREEILDYHKEAEDKVWLMRSRPCCHPEIEEQRLAGVERVLRTYDDIPNDGYTDWECGYWNGIMGALRWVMGDDKDYLDT